VLSNIMASKPPPTRLIAAGALTMQDLVGGRIDYQCDQIVTSKPRSTVAA
jgi:hypothetical protein